MHFFVVVSRDLSLLNLTVITPADFFYDFIPHNPVDAGYTWNSLLATDSIRNEPVPYFPGKHGWVFPFVLADGVHDMRGGDLWLAASDNSGAKISGFVKS